MNNISPAWTLTDNPSDKPTNEALLKEASKLPWDEDMNTVVQTPEDKGDLDTEVKPTIH